MKTKLTVKEFLSLYAGLFTYDDFSIMKQAEAKVFGFEPKNYMLFPLKRQFCEHIKTNPEHAALVNGFRQMYPLLDDIHKNQDEIASKFEKQIGKSYIDVSKLDSKFIDELCK